MIRDGSWRIVLDCHVLDLEDQTSPGGRQVAILGLLVDEAFDNLPLELGARKALAIGRATDAGWDQAVTNANRQRVEAHLDCAPQPLERYILAAELCYPSEMELDDCTLRDIGLRRDPALHAIDKLLERGGSVCCRRDAPEGAKGRSGYVLD